MYRFVLWGYGKRGKRFLRICPHEHVVAIIDGASEALSTEDNIPIIQYSEYKKYYSNYDIVIDVDKCEEIIKVLEHDNIYLYHILGDCPPEIVGFCGGRWLDKLPIKIEAGKEYAIYGLNLYTILLRDFLCEKYCINNIIINPEEENAHAWAFIEKYEYIDFTDAAGREIMYGSRYCSKKAPDRYEDVFDFSDKIEEYFNLQLASFKNIHFGEECFIVATGPSLTVDDLNLIDKYGYKCFGVNRIYLTFNDTKWRPDYLVVMDDKIIETYSNEILTADVNVKIIGDQASIGKTGINVHRLHDHVLEYYPSMPKFSEEIDKKVYSGRTVTYTCIQLACYMGFKKIYLIGADHNYTSMQSDVSNHFHKDYYNGSFKPDSYDKDKVELSYKAAKMYADLHGIEIYNVSRGGKLEVFPRKNLEDVISDRQ